MEQTKNEHRTGREREKKEHFHEVQEKEKEEQNYGEKIEDNTRNRWEVMLDQVNCEGILDLRMGRLLGIFLGGILCRELFRM